MSLPWWKTTSIYHISPRSFQDSNGDGIGDLRGVIQRLDYIRDLGFETIWLSPFFASPQRDWGYDISDYYAVAPEYGTLDDVDDLIAAVHARGMRVIFDLVLNHTSEEHPWFQESRRDRENPKRQWYIWQDGRGLKPPTNWKSFVGGSGWHLDHATGQWYYASFLPFQPDLNFRTPQVKAAMFDVARYWLDRGVDGFRLDIFHAIYKDASFRDNPPSWRYLPDGQAGFFQEMRHTLHQPETFALARELRSLATSYSPERMLLGEVFGPDAIVRRYLGEQGDGLNLIFLWDLLRARVSGRFFRAVLRHFEEAYPEPMTPVIVWGNHDVKRVLSRLSKDPALCHSPALGRLLAVFQMTARGVPVVYYGEEIGMQEAAIGHWRAKDPLARRYRWLPRFLADALGLYLNRDGCRTPMQWDASPNAGFCPQEARPWMPVHPCYSQVNVAVQQGDPDSLLNTYRRLLRLRRENPALRYGALEVLDVPEEEKDLVVYRRQHEDTMVVVALNFGKRPAAFANPTGCGRVLFAAGLETPPESDRWTLPPLSALILGGVYK